MTTVTNASGATGEETARLKRELRVARETPAVVEEPPMPPLI